MRYKLLKVCLLAMLVLQLANPPCLDASVGVKEDGVTVGIATDIDFIGDVDVEMDGGKAIVTVANTSLFALGLANGNISNMETTVTAVPTSYGVVNMVISEKTATLANGTTRQILVLKGKDRMAGTLTITPATTTGFTSITIDENGEFVTLLYLNDTVGWVVVGINGATVVLPT